MLNLVDSLTHPASVARREMRRSMAQHVMPSMRPAASMCPRTGSCGCCLGAPGWWWI